MKILHIVEGMYYGGSEVHVLTNCEAAMFASNAVYSLVSAPGDDNDFSRHFLESGVEIYYNNLESVVQEFDVIHLYGATQHENVLALVKQRPFVWTMTFNTVAPLVDAPILCTSFQTLVKQNNRNECYLYRCAVNLDLFNPEIRQEHDGINLIRVCATGKSESILDEVIADLLDQYKHCSYYVINDPCGITHPRIYSLGRVPDIKPYLAKSDIFVYAPKQPSACTCDICVIEAMAVGLPVVATNAWQVIEQIDHGETGILTDGSGDSFRCAIEFLLQNPSETQRLSQNSYERVLELFDIQSRMPLLSHVYSRALELKGTST